MVEPIHLRHPTATRPLVVDLDGTLCRTDTLWESFFAAWRQHGWLPLAALFWLLSGRQKLKSKIATLALPDVARLPWNRAVLAALQRAREQEGRPCVLATAANERIAHACAETLGGFDRVLASTDTLNLKGAAKAKLLVELYGAQGFDYIGDSRADLPVWAQAAQKWSVSSVVPIGGERLAESGAPSSAAGSWAAWARELRVRHWVKNILVFVALVAAHEWAQPAAWQAAAASFVAFCCVCSAVYIVNDLFDLASDRAHPTKQRRPLAAGALSLAQAFAVAVLLLLLGAGIAWWVGSSVAVALLCYVVVNALYTVKLKRMPVVDVFCLAALYTLRIVAGAVAVAVPLSTWLVAFSVFLFLSLALLKRAADLDRLNDEQSLAGRGYVGRDRYFVSALGVGAAINACLVLMLYIASDQVASMYGQPLWLWGVSVIVLFWLARLWRLAMLGQMDDDPIFFATGDAVSWACAALTLVCVALAV